MSPRLFYIKYIDQFLFSIVINLSQPRACLIVQKKKTLFKPVASCYESIMSTTNLKNKNDKTSFLLRVISELGLFFQKLFRQLDRAADGNLSFFFRNWGKSKFMISMSKRVQMHGLENVFLKSRRAFFYFFMFYLIRDTILYILIPIYFAKSTGN